MFTITNEKDVQSVRCVLPNTLVHGDCLEVMKYIPSNSIDLVLCDPPFGTTACKWDSVIPFEPMWVELKRIIKPNGAIVLFGSEPFSSLLRVSNLKMFKYDWKWDKVNSGNFVTAKYRPLSILEDIMIFGKNKINYYPIMTVAIEKNIRPRDKSNSNKREDVSIKVSKGEYKTSENHNEKARYPKNLLSFDNRKAELNSKHRLHPTQKPVALLEYLIKTYTQENETVLDFTMGSGSTGVACLNTSREFIGIEMNKGYFDICVNRIHEICE